MARIEILSFAEREGMSVSSSYQLSLNAIDVCIFYPMFDPKELADLTFEFALNMQVSDDGVQWKLRGGMTCVGVSDVWTEQPSLEVPMISVKGKYVRANITVNKKVTYKLEMEDGL